MVSAITNRKLYTNYYPCGDADGTVCKFEGMRYWSLVRISQPSLVAYSVEKSLISEPVSTAAPTCLPLILQLTRSFGEPGSKACLLMNHA